MYHPEYVSDLPLDVYSHVVMIAKSYHQTKGRLAQYEGVQPQQAVHRWQIESIEQVWQSFSSQIERSFIEQHFFQNIRMAHIDLPLSISTMKRTRAKFLRALARKLGLY